MFPAYRAKRKDGRPMVKRYIRWILPLLVLAVIVGYFLVSPMLATHAAGTSAPAAPHQITTPHGATPDIYWRN